MTFLSFCSEFVFLKNENGKLWLELAVELVMKMSLCWFVCGKVSVNMQLSESKMQKLPFFFLVVLNKSTELQVQKQP